MLPADTPKLPTWPFLLGDAALLGLAWLVVSQARNPFAATPLIVIVGCVALGALLAVIPFLTDYARKQDEALDDRQRELEALARTVASSAEQISIAANGLHEITELAQHNLKAAEQLPAKLQEKIAGLRNQLDGARDEERDELKRELARLRAGDSERLESIIGKITQTATEWTRLEAALRQHLASATDALAQAGKIAPRPEPAEPVRREPLEVARPELVEAARPEPVEATPEAPASGAVEQPAAVVNSADASPVAAAATQPPKRPRKPRPAAPAAPETPIPADPPPTVLPPAAEEPPPLAAPIPEILPVAPDSSPPIALEPVVSTDVPPAGGEAPPPPPKPERKRAPRKPRSDSPAPENQAAAAPGLDLVSSTAASEAGEAVPASPAEPPRPEPPVQATIEAVERVPSSDGATRLLVTAYIGIGNRLFIRGAGPGLTWDKGVPLQFVSIGKWRWETRDAAEPVPFKLYKNDETECTALGAQTLGPGLQREVTATF
jgi:hypothetical protein